MYNQKRFNESFYWFMEEMQAEIVAKSGRPSDRFHLGKMVLHGLRKYPDFILQIDGATGASETNRSVLERTIRCANCMRSYGLRTGDVVTLMAPNHLDLCVPFYAALYLGVIVAAVDRNLSTGELTSTFNIERPKLIFCQSEKAPDVQRALNQIDHDAKIITFENGDNLCGFNDFLELHREDTPADEFDAADFDAENAVALLISTSGTTGTAKASAATHKNIAIATPPLWIHYWQFPTPTRTVLIGAPLQWLTSLVNFILSPIARYTRLQTTLPLFQEHCYEIINKYRPTWTVLSPTLLTSLVKQPDCQRCDFTCFETVLLGGSPVPVDLIQELKTLTPDTEVYNAYGISEIAGLGLVPWNSPKGSCGTFCGTLQYRLINIDTGEDIHGANTAGELLIKGPALFKGYYNNPEATREAFADDEWFRTGDVFYRDENYYFYFVERIKLLLRYKGHQISPVELETLIRTHPGVLDVAVSSISDPECGDLPVACVVKRKGYEVTAQEIKDIVKENLTDSKQLRGGIIFVPEIPMTATTKVHRRKLKAMVQDMK